MKHLKSFNESNQSDVIKSYKLFEGESYYKDDMNVDITSTVIDMLQDLIDDGLTINCFTVGYITLKQAGVKYTENDIGLYIMANGENDVEYKTLDYKKLIPYLERVISYIVNEEDRLVVDINFYWREKGFSDLKGMKYEYKDGCFYSDLYSSTGVSKFDSLDKIPDANYDSISMKFKLKK